MLEVLGRLHAILARAGKQEHLAIKIMPQFARNLELWIEGVRNRDGLPTPDEMLTSFVEPLMSASPHRRRRTDRQALWKTALGSKGSNSRVRQAARKMGPTRPGCTNC